MPETRKLLDDQFDGVPVTKQNLSEWRQGGYREWVIRDELRSKASELSDAARELDETVEAPLLAGNLATVLAAQYAKVLTEWDGEPNAKIEAKLRLLRILCRDIALLQRTMHRSTTQKNEFYQKLEDDDKKEIQEMKDRALAPIWAAMDEDSYAKMFPDNEAGRKMAAFVAAIENDQPLSKFARTPAGGQTESHPVKPIKPVKLVKPQLKTEEPVDKV